MNPEEKPLIQRFLELFDEIIGENKEEKTSVQLESKRIVQK